MLDGEHTQQVTVAMTDLAQLESQILADVAAAGDEAALEIVRVAALGKKGSISALLATLGPLWVVIAVFAVLAVVRAKELFGIALLFFIPHWLSPHKELRI